MLVGGSTRIPKVQQMIKDYFNGKEPNKGVTLTRPSPTEQLSRVASCLARVAMR